MRSPCQYVALLRHLGPKWALFRVTHAVRRRSGHLRRATPATDWAELTAPTLDLQPCAGPRLTPPTWSRACVAQAEDILAGRFRLFSHRVVAAGYPPDWHCNQLACPVADEPGPSRSLAVRHWTELSDSSSGDIKGVWELSRFAWAFTLTRAYQRTDERRFVDAFWELFSDWCRYNPPNLGPNWMCGQEAAFRLIAVTFAAENLGVPDAHREALGRFIFATGCRIAANLDYALSQANNHGVSECVGLATAALLLRGSELRATWLGRAQRALRAQLEDLVYHDGGFSQHSLIYHRVLLHDLCWCRRRLEIGGHEIPEWLEAAGRRALEHLMVLTDPDTGLAPLYGSNDGADVLPLADAEFLDLRPVIQMAAAQFRRDLPLAPGPWDEAAAWLDEAALTLPRTGWPDAPTRWRGAIAGSAQLVNGCSRLFVRCPTFFRHRPAQADMSHVDIWHLGRPIAMDGGSFSYNSTERFAQLGMARYHNVLTVDGEEPLKKFSRFLYLPWPRGEVGEIADGFRCSHNGWARAGVRWTREVSAALGEGFVVRDRVQGAAGHRLLWHWRLVDAPWKLAREPGRVEVRAEEVAYEIEWTGSASPNARLVRADPDSAYGWWSPHYGEAVPAVALLLEVATVADIEFTTTFRPLAKT